MAKVRITTPEQQPWQVSSERPRSDLSNAAMEDGGPASAYKIREPGSEADPQLVELRFHPGEEIELHCHDEPEIIYVLEGAMKIGSRTVGPGACIFIDGGVFYGFTAGPEGLHFLNFRSHIDTSFHLPDGHKSAAASVSA